MSKGSERKGFRLNESTLVDVVTLGLIGFRVLEAVEEDGEVEFRVETVRARVGPGCGVVAEPPTFPGRFGASLTDRAAGGSDGTWP